MINYDMNWYDVMRQIINNAVDGKNKSQTSVYNYKDGKQYWIEATYTIKELHFQDEHEFMPQEVHSMTKEKRT